MIGKKNIVFGFFYLVLSAALGPVMVNMYTDYATAVGEKQQHVGRLQALQQNEFEEDLETLSAEQIAIANTSGILSLNKILNIENAIDPMVHPVQRTSRASSRDLHARGCGSARRNGPVYRTWP